MTSTSAVPAVRLSTLADSAALTLLALAINLVHLGSKSILYDEAGSVVYTSLTPAAFWDVIITKDPNQSLYYLVLCLWVRLFGESEAAIRFPSAVFGALAVGALYLLGRHLFGRAAGIVAGLLLAFDAFMVQYAQTARAYALLVLMVTLASLFLARVLERPSRGNQIAYVATSALAIYLHYFAFFVLAAHAITVVTSKQKAVLRRPWPAMAAAIAIAYLPAVLIVYSTPAGGRLNWIEPSSMADIVPLLTDLAGGSWWVLAALLGAGCYGALLASRQGRAQPFGFVAAWLVVPIALAFLISLAKPIFLAYYLIICVPALVLFGAAGIVCLRPPIVARALVVCLLCISVVHLRQFYAAEGPQNWRAASSYVLASIQPGDGVVYFPESAHKPVGYYARQRGVAEPANRGGQALADRNRVWLVIRTSDVAGRRDQFLRIQSSLRERWRLADRREFGLVAIEMYAR